MHVMIFGCGYSGTAIAKAFAGENMRVSGTTRSPDKMDVLRQNGIDAFLFDGETMEEGLRRALADVTHLVQSIAPGKADPLLRLLGEDGASLLPRLEWIGYLSTVGVYGDHQGAWIDEETPCVPVSGRSKERLEAEAGWLAMGETCSVPAAVLRLSGIYGPGRNAFCNLERGTARRLIKKNQVFNRIRVEDIGAATRFLSEHGLSGIYNVTDDRPGPPQEVIVEAARLMGVEPPPEQAFETAELTPMARSFYGENKRVSNAKLKAAGFEFSFPDYPMSLAQLWRDGRWRG
ncbi:nucleoside-diphosphate-sugar epimerase [Rhizobium leguminosarum]|uniref:Nucleoside-diphosphate-sugar epimerase n=1 Tax=Rhizobium leguminosarum TaxID=384 RepID=A0AAE2MEW8_RHILE|nr:MULTISPECIES: SDR family oxidoreductase [Rhizobium]MBB4288076.1 nucleoside-diphosphate-sugar epimerase [Rhizobium leguminosarum]MBB4295833.1 nucleoside-diphosphate-sugar epimerase [Rhizobium leguminosarum]MBB4307225.1 nucleoside-diphosphate-sugar epimerase [Rhizobium leguminosarum]MBB4417192.1 nucleoside-diphosphate-sugar epimerase [Rhizobium leguminosarum]MBB4432036.1 nucleoside-diphosphate-sugar epimerase [Rhizobium esperanzae]